MRSFILAAILAVAASSHAASTKPEVTEKVSVNQLEQSLSLVHGKSDADMAQALSTLELTDRLSGVRLAHLEANLPGEKAQQALLIVADQSVFLPPPDDEIVADPAPDAAATRQMLVKIVAYVNTTVRQLPNLMAVRETTSFQDRPAEDRVDATGTLSLGYLPVHFMGKSALAVTYRDRKEVVDESATKALKHGTAVGGLATSGEFGPILSTVLADAIKGTITWARWEQGTVGNVAVFHYVVPEQKSNYNVEFCCIANGFRGDGQPDMQVFDERAAYHGEIAFNAADGSILRLTLEAEMPPAGLVPHAGIAIEYSSVEIGGRDYICPAKSVSILQAHTAMPQGTESRSKYKGPAKTFLNDVAFKDYRRFGSETHILAGYDQAPEK